MQITKDNLLQMVDTIKNTYKGKDSDFYRTFLSAELLRLIVGNEWTNQVCFKEHPSRKKKFDEDFHFLCSDRNEIPWQENLEKLAETLFNLQKINGFEHILSKIRQGQLFSRIAEIEIGKHLCRRDIEFEFVEPKKIKEEDFDIKILNPEINIEVKHKKDKSILSKDKFEKLFSEANKQLPSNELSIISIHIPEIWIKDKDFEDYVIRATNSFFQRHKSILGVLLRWKEDLNGNIFLYKFNFIKNNYSDKYSEEINIFIDKLVSQNTSNNWVNFINIFN